MWGGRIVRAVAATLAAIAFTTGLVNLTWPDTEHSKRATHDRVAAYPSGSPSPTLRFLVTAIGLNPTERRLQATLAYVPSTDGLTYFDTNGQSITGSDRLKPELADAKVEIQVGNGDLERTKVSYPLEYLVMGYIDRPDGREISFSLPADVDPSQFPNDSYNFALHMTASLPLGVTAIARGSDPEPGRGDGSDVPVIFGLAVDERLGQWHLDTDQTVAATQGYDNHPYGYSEYAPVVHVEFKRGLAYWAFIYAVSLMPAVIGLSFYIRTRRQRGTTDASAAMELAAALLALIALRQVFVPTDIVALTRLDFLLGVQLLVVCWLMAVTYVAEPRPARRKPRPQPRKRRPIPKIPDGAVKR